jgi:hypothetical protein
MLGAGLGFKCRICCKAKKRGQQRGVLRGRGHCARVPTTQAQQRMERFANSSLSFSHQCRQRRVIFGVSVQRLQ